VRHVVRLADILEEISQLAVKLHRLVRPPFGFRQVFFGTRGPERGCGIERDPKVYASGISEFPCVQAI
jgi:hypothetical protein